MEEWDVFFTKFAEKQLKKAGRCTRTINKLIDILRTNPYAVYPCYEKLQSCDNFYSRRINIRHRLVYQVLENEHAVKIISIWGHYDDN